MNREQERNGEKEPSIPVQKLEIDKRIKIIEKEIEILLKEKKELVKRWKFLDQSINIFAIDDDTDYESLRFPWFPTVKSLFLDKFKLTEFKSLQLKALNATINKQDCILIKPPNGGKSLCYQLPSMISGFTLTISPSISLMQDQMFIMEKLGISCISLDCHGPGKVQNQIYKAMQNDPIDNVTYKVIYISPEKIIESKKLMKSIEKAYSDNRIARVVMDEIHCCSEWAHDFRPVYKDLNIFKSLFPKLPILGLTSTATNKIVGDIKEILGLNTDCLVLRDRYYRPNLFFDIKLLSNDDDELVEVLNLIQTRFMEQSGIVFCFTQKDCERVTKELVANGIKACFYHGKLNFDERRETHGKWLDEEYHVIVATIAFGMGIDKPNVRFVIHMSISKSLENYYQETGRAGHDGKRADCILFWKLSEFFKIASNQFIIKEKMGITNLNTMSRFSLEEGQCKRALFSMMFDELPSVVVDCKGMCCVCADTESEIVSVDISDIYNSALYIVKKVQLGKNPRITAKRIIGELHNAKEDFKLNLIKRFPGIDYKVVCDRGFCYLVIEGYLKLDYSEGSFSNHTYILPGDKTLYPPGSSLNINIRIPPRSESTQPVESEGTNAKKTPKKKTPKKRRNEEPTDGTPTKSVNCERVDVIDVDVVDVDAVDVDADDVEVFDVDEVC